MAEAEEKKDPAEVKGGETPSMEEILQSIRGVISGDEAVEDESDVLELTEVVEEAGEAVAAANPIGADVTTTPEGTAPEKSILDDIDAALDNGAAPATAETPAIEAEAPAAEAKLAPVVEATAEPEPSPAPTPEPIATPAEESSVGNAAAGTEDAGDSASEATKDAAESENTDADLSDVDDGNSPDDDAPQTKSSNSDRLLGERAAKQSSGSLKELVSNIHDKHVDSPYSRGGTSLEDLVIEAMKPFLAEWLNKNLPVIVKKIVEKEVKRLIPKEDDD